MKPNEILAALPQWAEMPADAVLASPAWAMPCRLGETQCMMRLDGLAPADTLDIAIRLEDEPHTLSILDTPRFKDLHALWSNRGEVPEPILLALVEKECGALLQLIENATRRQLKVEGMASKAEDRKDEGRICPRLHFDGGETFPFAITSSPALVAALGQLRFIDTAHPAVRETALSAETEIASFALGAADVASLAPGDALLLPEVGSLAPRLVVDARFVVDANGVSPFSDDGRLRVVESETRTVTLGDIFDGAWAKAEDQRSPSSVLRLVKGGETVAEGRLGRVGGQPAFVTESNRM